MHPPTTYRTALIKTYLVHYHHQARHIYYRIDLNSSLSSAVFTLVLTNPSQFPRKSIMYSTHRLLYDFSGAQQLAVTQRKPVRITYFFCNKFVLGFTELLGLYKTYGIFVQKKQFLFPRGGNIPKIHDIATISICQYRAKIWATLIFLVCKRNLGKANF